MNCIDGDPIIRVNKITDDADTKSRDFDPLSFLAEIAQHIPLQWEQTSRFFGLYSARTRGAKRLSLDTPGPLPEQDPPPKPSSYWAACMKQVYESTPLSAQSAAPI